MKYITLIIGLLSVGCLTPEQKQKAFRDSVVGEYELKYAGHTFKHVYLENGIMELYINGKKELEHKWSIVNGAVHVKYRSGGIEVWRLNTDKSIAYIDKIRDGKRADTNSDGVADTQSITSYKSITTYKRIKELTPEEQKKQKAFRDSVVGEYVFKDEDGNTYKEVFLDNGVSESYINGKKLIEHKWSIMNGEIHVTYGIAEILILRINTDKSFTAIATIKDGKRKAYPKDQSKRWKKIKELTPEEQKKQKALRDSVVGEYEFKGDRHTYKWVYLENGVSELYTNGKKQAQQFFFWSIVNEKIHMYESVSKRIAIWRINTDKSITPIAYIDTNRKRKAYPKELQSTYKRIK